ncbi:MAG: hypothetical protein HQ472_01405 [Ignavibacteria bacterium]|nr:hypothetical protein [Ignavibacteria bacterium]
MSAIHSIESVSFPSFDSATFLVSTAQTLAALSSASMELSRRNYFREEGFEKRIALPETSPVELEFLTASIDGHGELLIKNVSRSKKMINIQIVTILGQVLYQSSTELRYEQEIALPTNSYHGAVLIRILYEGHQRTIPILLP